MCCDILSINGISSEDYIVVVPNGLPLCVENGLIVHRTTGRIWLIEGDELALQINRALVSAGSALVMSCDAPPFHDPIEEHLNGMIRAGKSIEEINAYLDSVRESG